MTRDLALRLETPICRSTCQTPAGCGRMRNGGSPSRAVNDPTFDQLGPKHIAFQQKVVISLERLQRVV